MFEKHRERVMTRTWDAKAVMEARTQTELLEQIMQKQQENNELLRALLTRQ